MATTQTPRDRSGPLRRLPGADISTAEAIFQAAMSLLVPDDQTQRKAFEGLMPFMYVLRNKGCSWAQLTKLLTHAGFVLQPSTVRRYYAEMLATRLDICQERMNEQILLLAEVRKETKGVDVGDIGKRVAAIMNTQRAQVASKLDSVFGVAPVVSLPAAAPVPVMPISPPPTKAVEPVAALTNAVAPPENFKYRCTALPDGVIPLKLREGMPEAFYLPGYLEHTAVPGVMLSLEQRLSSVALEFVNTEDGKIRIETPDEKRFRVLWRKPIPMTKSSTSDSFTKIDESLFSRS